jgi:hypothetical protein
MCTTFHGVQRCSFGALIACIAAACLIAGCGASAEKPNPPPIASPAPASKPATTNKKKTMLAPVSSRQQRYRQRAQAAEKGQ